MGKRTKKIPRDVRGNDGNSESQRESETRLAGAFKSWGLLVGLIRRTRGSGARRDECEEIDSKESRPLGKHGPGGARRAGVSHYLGN